MSIAKLRCRSDWLNFSLTEAIEPRSIADVVVSILTENNRPMLLSDLAENVRKSRSVSEPAIVAVSYAIKKDKRVISFGNALYGLKGWKKSLNPNDFRYSTPAKNWIVSQVLTELMEDCDNTLKIACPYIDKSTFEMFLAKTPAEANIQLLVTRDLAFSSKVRGGLTTKFFSEWLKNRKFSIRRISEMHSRFVVMDDSFAILMSADLQGEQQQKKYQYLVTISDPLVTANCSEYFDRMWESADAVDLISEIQAIEST